MVSTPSGEPKHKRAWTISVLKRSGVQSSSNDSFNLHLPYNWIPSKHKEHSEPKVSKKWPQALILQIDQSSELANTATARKLHESGQLGLGFFFPIWESVVKYFCPAYPLYTKSYVSTTWVNNRSRKDFNSTTRKRQENALPGCFTPQGEGRRHPHVPNP